MNAVALPQDPPMMADQGGAGQFTDTQVIMVGFDVNQTSGSRDRSARQREQSRPVEPLMTRQQITVPSKIADLNPRVVTETSLHLLIGPLEQIGIDPERGGQGWRCAIALVFVLAKPRPADGYPAAKAYVGSVDFFGQNAEAQRREWINSQRGKGRDVLQLPTRQAIEALDRADGKKLCQYGILPAKSRS